MLKIGSKVDMELVSSMCRALVFEFFIDNVDLEEFKDKRILEVGSRYVNGSIRPFIERFLEPKEYVGIDIEPGKFVDIVLSAEKLVEHFGPESFDVVVCTETLEHIRDWRAAINNMKNVLKPNGYMYITTVKRGFPYHEYPWDFWRYEIEDMKAIFSDFNILVLKEGPENSILLKAKKPLDWKPTDLSNIALYSMILGRRTRIIPSVSDIPLAKRVILKTLHTKAIHLLPNFIIYLLRKRSS